MLENAVDFKPLKLFLLPECLLDGLTLQWDFLTRLGYTSFLRNIVCFFYLKLVKLFVEGVQFLLQHQFSLVDFFQPGILL